MVRIRRTVRRPKVKKAKEYDSDDPAAYEGMPVPDKKSSKYTEDEIDEYHNDRISKLLAHGVQRDSDQEDIGDDEEEVMALNVSDSEEEEENDFQEDEEEKEDTDMESDLEGKKEDELPSEMAWGRRKKTYYDSDYVTVKGKSKEEADAEDEEEEEEARNIQKRLVGNLSEEDYDLHLLQEFGIEEDIVEKSEEKEKQTIVKDLKQMSQKEKLKLLKKESPELLELIQDFKAKVTELRDELQPLLNMVKDGRIPAGKGAEYLKTKQQLYLNYCTNISFYLVLKAKRIPAHNHPVIERLVSYRNLINELNEVDARLAPQLRQLLSGTHLGTTKRSTDAESRMMAREADSGNEEESDSELDEEAALQMYREVERRLKLKRMNKHLDSNEQLDDEEDEEMDLEADTKRSITYQMNKNKGLTPKRKKIDRNPRVKYREKFRRAKIRRKGQVREVHQEEKRYSGELFGIRAGVKKSVKLK